ncbi:hypothetical protein [Streptomyces sp. 1222.5]|uniref:hypothetical protein n=1 Tax=Streptomyces sp. 1222.5 TaxID=1881026 RepID=UPI003D760729
MLRATGSGRATDRACPRGNRGRRGAVTAASAAALCLGGVLASCAGGSPGGGYAAVGAGDGTGPGTGTPTGSVTLVPLDGENGEGTGGRQGDGRDEGGKGAGDGRVPRTAGSGPAGDRGTTDDPQEPARDGTPGSGSDADASHPADGTGRTGHTGDGTGRATPAPGPTTHAPDPSPSRTSAPRPSPADLSWGDPATADADQRWCQKVTVGFHNSGGTAVRSGSVTFGTHIIGGLGIDWGTVESTEGLPAPIGPGARTDHTWTVCVDAWRVPLGMHIETRDVTVRWR